ncbi:MAG TPA: ABC transporter ATP-binding protein [Gemmatimonadaceae bacterium]|nr:ABC transporter ATP-binding protein [Gemmatimonadaceae bacterium]
MPAIQLEHVLHRYGATVALRDLSLTVEEGEVFSLLGHNGAGKTTTVRIINGLLSPAAGSVRVFGQSPATDGPSIRRRTAVLTESPTLDDRLTAGETLRAFAEMYDVAPAEIGPRVKALLSEFGIADRGNDRVGGFSRGMKQRLSLARSLVHDPDLLFLDEPTAGLDPAATQQLHQTVRQMARTRGRTVVLCTHNLVEAQMLSDRVAVLGGGSLLALGTPSELARRMSPRLEVSIEVEPAQLDAANRTIAALDGLTVTTERAGVIRVGGLARDRVPDLNARLVGAGVSVFRLEPHEPSLTDAYFALQQANESGGAS